MILYIQTSSTGSVGMWLRGFTGLSLPTFIIPSSTLFKLTWQLDGPLPGQEWWLQVWQGSVAVSTSFLEAIYYPPAEIEE
jgi:hypothetical protein